MTAVPQIRHATAGDTDPDEPARRRAAQSFWARYFTFYDALNDAPPYRQMIAGNAALLDARPGDMILDAGTGTGNVAVELLAKGASVTGIDFVESALELCRRKAPGGDFRYGDLRKELQFPTGHFDKVACCVVLQFLDRPAGERVVREFFRVLKPGGLASVTVFAKGFQSRKVFLETMRVRWQAGGAVGAVGFALRHSLVTARILYYVHQIKRRERSGDYTFYGSDDLRGLLTQAGLEVVSIESAFAGQSWTALGRKPALTGRAQM
jgi:ubiquinone/menaquinone biosynthesis C-methylase UbiE